VTPLCAGGLKTAPVVTLNLEPCQGQVTTSPSSVPLGQRAAAVWTGVVDRRPRCVFLRPPRTFQTLAGPLRPTRPSRVSPSLSSVCSQGVLRKGSSPHPLLSGTASTPDRHRCQGVFYGQWQKVGPAYTKNRRLVGSTRASMDLPGTRLGRPTSRTPERHAVHAVRVGDGLGGAEVTKERLP
jgi:hypothetical protein